MKPTDCKVSKAHRFYPHWFSTVEKLTEFFSTDQIEVVYFYLADK
jgi:hypothetical protein